METYINRVEVTMDTKAEHRTTSINSSTDKLGHSNFILGPNSPDDWRCPQNANLWRGVNGTNNPCPSGYRLPMESELDAERLSWDTNDVVGAFASPLKWTAAGYHNYTTGWVSHSGQ